MPEGLSLHNLFSIYLWTCCPSIYLISIWTSGPVCLCSVATEYRISLPFVQKVFCFTQFPWFYWVSPTLTLWNLLYSARPPPLWFCKVEFFPLSALPVIKRRILGFTTSLFKASVSVSLHSFIISPPVLWAFLSLTEMLKQKSEAQRRKRGRHKAWGWRLLQPRPSWSTLSPWSPWRTMMD